MRGLVEATRRALTAANVPGERIAAIALDTTGSSVIPVGQGMVPLDDYYLCGVTIERRAKPRDHGAGAPRRPQSHRVVRRGVFVGVGICQAAALAAS